jgi:hypothetical protein
MLVLRKLKSYICKSSQHYYHLSNTRYYINCDCVGLYKWKTSDIIHLFSYNGYVSHTVYTMINHPNPHYCLSLTIYSDRYISKTYDFKSYKRDFSDIKITKC